MSPHIAPSDLDQDGDISGGFQLSICSLRLMKITRQPAVWPRKGTALGIPKRL